MNVFTDLPLGTAVFRHWAPDDREIGVIVAKAVFDWTGDGFETVMEPPELRFSDVPDTTSSDDPALAATLWEQDIAPGKIGTDLILRGAARAPGGRPLRDWPVSVAIPEVLRYGFHVRGPVRWEWGRDGWDLGEVEEVTSVPLRYGLAYGGPVAAGRADGDTSAAEDRGGDAGTEEAPDAPAPVHDLNPAGIGFATRDRLYDDTPFPAARIGQLAEFLSGDPLAPMQVCGTMPVAKGWLPRRALAGTFDAEWQARRHPRMPEDYDLGFWNHAPRGLQIATGLRGDETLVLQGLDTGTAPRGLALPGVGVLAHLTAPGRSTSVAMTLDTVDLDLANAEDGPGGPPRLELTWRSGLARPDAIDAVDLEGVDLEDVPEDVR
ncbi:MAG: DUF2169 family type VI secretion system accessory protein [Shimia sp.]